MTEDEKVARVSIRVKCQSQCPKARSVQIPVEVAERFFVQEKPEPESTSSVPERIPEKSIEKSKRPDTERLFKCTADVLSMCKRISDAAVRVNQTKNDLESRRNAGWDAEQLVSYENKVALAQRTLDGLKVKVSKLKQACPEAKFDIGQDELTKEYSLKCTFETDIAKGRKVVPLRSEEETAVAREVLS